MNPTLNNILIQRIPDQKQTQSGIILKSSLEQDRGLILKIGPDVTEVQPNQTIILNWNQATHIQDELYIVPINEVIMVLENVWSVKDAWQTPYYSVIYKFIPK